MAVADNQPRAQDPESRDRTGPTCFSIPEDIKKRIDRNRMILVMDLDETMVFTRRKKPPTHSNYVTLIVSHF